MRPVYLEDRAVIAVSGSEARGFLQGLITNDIEKLSPGSALYAALLTPQGKVLFDFIVAEGDGALLIDCAVIARASLLERLGRFRLRAKVGIEAREQLGVYAELEGRPSERGITFPDPRLAALGHRTIGARAEMPTETFDMSVYHAHRLALGVPEAADFGSDKIFALDADIEELHGVSFDKGCYVGQELTARMKHRGTARKRLLPVAALGGNFLPPSETKILAGTQEIGEIVSVYGAHGFALVRLERWNDSSAPLAGANIPLALTRPQWFGGTP